MTDSLKQPLGVLILHGFASSLDSVQGIAQPLQEIGLPVGLPVLRGHGGNSPEALRGVQWQDWIADSEAALLSLADDVERVIVVGHSMGGELALYLAANHAMLIDSLVLAAAAIQLENPLAPGRPLHFLLPLVMRLFKRWDLPPEYADPSLSRFDTNYHWAPMDAIAAFLDFSATARACLPEVHAPALILHSRRDAVAAPESAEIILRQIATPAGQKRIIWFETTSHEMFQDVEREAVIQAVVEYARERMNLPLTTSH